jgi:hypothetical protein
MRKMLAAFGATAVLVAGGLVTASSPAHASDLPYDGQDPVSSGCSNSAVTVATAPIKAGDGTVLGRVDLRWSNACHTNWARTVSYGSIESYGAPVAYVTRTSDNKQYSSNYGAPGGTVWTPMVYGQALCVYATGGIDLAGFADTSQVC